MKCAPSKKKQQNNREKLPKDDVHKSNTFNISVGKFEIKRGGCK